MSALNDDGANLKVSSGCKQRYKGRKLHFGIKFAHLLLLIRGQAAVETDQREKLRHHLPSDTLHVLLGIPRCSVVRGNRVLQVLGLHQSFLLAPHLSSNSGCG